MSDRVATIKGTFLVPTVSKNRRLYTRENIGSAVLDMQRRIASESSLPLTMFPSHRKADEGNALETIGKITKVHQEDDGSGTFEADIANTTAGRDMAALLDPKNPFVKGISIRGAWASEPKTVEAYDGKEATTADSLMIDGVDWTHRPGVDGAAIHDLTYEDAPIEMSENFVFESAEAEAVFFDEAAEDEPIELSVNEQAATKLQEAAELLLGADEATTAAPYGDVTYADPGYQKDKKKRYPINTAAHVRAAWSYINQSKNGGAYSSGQLARIKSRIKSAAKKFGINISEDMQQLTDDLQELLAAYAVEDSTVESIDVTHIARKLAMEAMMGLGDIESIEEIVEAVDNNDNDMSPSAVVCANCTNAVPQDAMYCPTCGQAVSAAESSPEEEEVTTEEIVTPDDTNDKKEPTMAEETPAPEATETETETVAPVETAPVAPTSITMTNEQFAQLLAAATAPREAAPAAEETPVVEEPKVYTAEDIEAIKAEAKQVAENEALEAARAAGIIPRQGLVGGQTAGQFAAPVAATKAPSLKELSEMSEDEYFSNTYEALASHPGWNGVMRRADQRARGW